MKKARPAPLKGSEELALWHSDYHHPNINYEVTGPGFKPKVAPVTIAIEYPRGVFRKITKIAPYSLPDGGFAVMMPYHKENAGSLSKMQAFDTLSRSLILPPPSVIEAYSVSSKAKLSFHSDGVTQFSSIVDGTIISGRDPATGEFKGLGIQCRPFTRPVWSGPILSIDAWGLDDFEECSPGRNIIVFKQAEIRNPYLREQSDAVRIELSMAPRREPLASKGFFPDYRAEMKTWNPNSRLFSRREVRLIALNSPEIALIVFAANFPNLGGAASGYRLAGPRDARSFGLYAAYPRTSEIAFSGSLDRSSAAQATSVSEKVDEN